MSDDNDNLRLADAIRELVSKHGVDTSYSRFWRAIVAAEIPAERHGAGWRVARADLPAIAVILKLTERAA